MSSRPKPTLKTIKFNQIFLHLSCLAIYSTVSKLIPDNFFIEAERYAAPESRRQTVEHRTRLDALRPHPEIFVVAEDTPAEFAVEFLQQHVVLGIGESLREPGSGRVLVRHAGRYTGHQVRVEQLTKQDYDDEHDHLTTTCATSHCGMSTG